MNMNIRRLVEHLAFDIALLYCLSGVGLFFFYSTAAHAEPDAIARSDIAHLRELVTAADKRYEQRFNAQESAVAAALTGQEKAIAAALSAAKEAVSKAEIASEKRFDSINEFRAQLRDQQNTFMTRIETEQRIDSLAAQLNLLQQRVDKDTGKDAGAANLWGYLIGALGLAIAFGSFLRSRELSVMRGGKS